MQNVAGKKQLGVHSLECLIGYKGGKIGGLHDCSSSQAHTLNSLQGRTQEEEEVNECRITVTT